MLMFLTIIMLIASLVSVIKGGLHKSLIKSYRNHYYVDEHDKMVEKNGVSTEHKINLVTKSCGYIILMFILAVVQLIFLIASISVDVLVFPSLIMLLWFVFGIVLAFVRKKKKTNKEIMESRPKGAIRRLVFLFYVIYIFVLLLI